MFNSRFNLSFFWHCFSFALALIPLAALLFAPRGVPQVTSPYSITTLDPTRTAASPKPMPSASNIIIPTPSATNAPQNISLQLTAKDIQDAFLEVNREEAWLKGLGVAATVVITIILATTPFFIKAYLNSRFDDAERKQREELEKLVRDMCDRLEKSVKDNHLAPFETSVEKRLENSEKFEADYRANLEKKIEDSTASSRQALSGAIAALEDTRKQLVSDIDGLRMENERKMKEERMSSRAAVAILFWTLHDLDTAIYHATHALEAAQSLLVTIPKTNASVDMSSVEGRLRSFTCQLKNDLAYYYAERFVRDQKQEDGEQALKYLREVVNEWEIFGKPVPVNLVETYLFVVANARYATGNERTEAYALLNDRGPELAAYLQAEKRSSLLDAYKQTFGDAASNTDQTDRLSQSGI